METELTQKEKFCKKCGAKAEYSERFHMWICTKDCGWHCAIYPEDLNGDIL